MLTRNRTSIALVLVILVSVVTACALVQQLTGVATGGSSDDPSGSVQPTPTATTPKPTPQPSATPTGPTTQADITAAVANYYRVTDGLYRKPPRDPYRLLLTVSRDEAFEALQDEMVDLRKSGWHTTGQTKVLSIDVGKKLEKTEYAVATCVDVSGVDVVDKTGKSTPNKDRPDRPSSAPIVKRIKTTWYVIQDHDGTRKC